jgi:hypothetical protein
MLMVGGAGDDRHDRSIASTAGDVFLTTGGAGDDRQDKSTDSTSGETFLPTLGCEDSRSTLSTAGVADFVLRKWGEVRLLRVAGAGSLELFPLLGIEHDDSEEELEDINVNGGRVVDEAAVRRAVAGIGFDAADRVGDDSVKSSSSTSFRDGRKSSGVGIGVVSSAGAISRSFVGVADALHVSNVVCFVFSGEDATEIPRGALATSVVMIRVFAFFAGSCDGEGIIGELSRSIDSTVFDNGGVLGRSEISPSCAGRVCDRCIGSRFFLFVTLAGSSGKTGEGDFLETGRGTGAALLCATGGEDSRSMISSDCGVGCRELEGASRAFANVRESFDPGFVTFANWLIGACGMSFAVLVRLALLALGTLLVVSCAVAGRLGFCFVCLSASQSSTVNGTPTLTIDSITQILAGLLGSNFVGPRFFGPSSSSSSATSSSRSTSPVCEPGGGTSGSSSGSSRLRSMVTSSIGVKLTRNSVQLSVTGCCRFPWMPLTSSASSSCIALRFSVGSRANSFDLIRS